MIFKWLKDERFGPSADISVNTGSGQDFLPVEISGRASPAIREHGNAGQFPDCPPLLAHRIDITLSDGRRLLIEGPTSLSAIMGFVQGLMT